jgi:hypothetical protein
MLAYRAANSMLAIVALALVALSSFVLHNLRRFKGKLALLLHQDLVFTGLLLATALLILVQVRGTNSGLPIPSNYRTKHPP